MSNAHEDAKVSKTRSRLLYAAYISSSTKAAFLGDSAFPNLTTNVSKGGKIRLYENLYEQYSRLALTVNQDRPLAIAGLEIRLIRALDVHGGFGVFESHRPGDESYLRRSLLWRRGHDCPSMIKIQFGSERAISVPSWSWMAYEGGIDYLNPPFNGTDWERGIKSPWTQQSSQESSWHTTDRRGNRVLEGKAYKFSVGNDDDITFDHEDNKEVENLGCVVIGTSKLGIDQKNKEYYVLVIGKQSGSGWERIGAGKLLGKSIAFDGATDVEIH